MNDLGGTVETAYFGYVDIEYWEYSLMCFYLFGLYLYFARRKNQRIKTQPEYKYFLWGLYAKILGGIFFSLIYFYYYKGGDTISYFYSALPLSKLSRVDLMGFFSVLFGDNNVENRQWFTMETGWPYDYIYSDDRTFMVIRLITPVIMLSFESYLITTVMIASLSYIGIWRCYQTFVRYFPDLKGQLAMAFLFMPSCIFWGSAILKDTFTFSAVFWYIHALDNVVFRRRRGLGNISALVISMWLIIAIKPYIFMSLFPLSLLWISYNRLARIRNAMIKYIVLPIGFAVMIGISLLIIFSMSESLDKFSPENALTTIMVTHTDLKRSEEYGANYFDVGEIEENWASVITKFPVATNAALFRPYLWECKNVVMILAGLENTFLLFMSILLLLRARVLYVITMSMNNPIVLLCISFTLFYGFVTGITTPNFGALVRFKIPLLPFFVSGLYIMFYILKRRRIARIHGHQFKFDDLTIRSPAMATSRARNEPVRGQSR